MKKTLLVSLSAAVLCVTACQTLKSITPAQITLFTANAITDAAAFGQITPAISNDLNTAAIGLSLMSQGTNITYAQVSSQLIQIHDPKMRAAVMGAVTLWSLFSGQAGADVGAGLAALADGIEAGLGNPPIVRSKMKARAWLPVATINKTVSGKAWRVK